MKPPAQARSRHAAEAERPAEEAEMDVRATAGEAGRGVASSASRSSKQQRERDRASSSRSGGSQRTPGVPPGPHRAGARARSCPELRDLVRGNSGEEIEQSIESDEERDRGDPRHRCRALCNSSASRCGERL